MLRKTFLALIAAAALGAAALVPNAASAKPWGFGGGWHGGWHPVHFYVGPSYPSCVEQHWVRTPVGPRLRWVNVCD